MKIRWRDQSGKPAACGEGLAPKRDPTHSGKDNGARQTGNCAKIEANAWMDRRALSKARKNDYDTIVACATLSEPFDLPVPARIELPVCALTPICRRKLSSRRRTAWPNGTLPASWKIIGAVFLLLPSSSGRVACTQRTPLPEPAPAVPGVYDPFRAMSLADGAGLRKQFAANDAVPSSAHGTLSCWVEPSVEREARSSTSHNQQHGVKTDA
jgi:hypothetical protein